MIPLRICIAITIHKCQGMTIGPGQQFERVVVHLPESGTRKNPGIELVAISRAMNPTCFAIGNHSSTLTTMDIKKIGNGPSYESRRRYESNLRLAANHTERAIKEKILHLDPNESHQTYEGGCEFLLQWYQEKQNLINQ